MGERVVSVLIFLSALGSGLAGGIFFAFSTFVMGALARLPAPQGIAAMQSINIVVINPLFMMVFMGTAVLCAVVAVAALFGWAGPHPALVVVGAVIYIAGNIVVTMAGNVPLNDALAAVDPASAGGAAIWARYVPDWTVWNHVRTVTGAVAAACFILAWRWPAA
ncbi:anthrone oxygenase family protein [Inquilinus limosus]|uniref:Membrane protein n=1 Tax=Inquilinus limosus MP06 TaxID=1398085 RepID=A0A0A0CZG7_9PROT|nr:anthrone oxygenase family protein [Inquilinus limosus]KGM30943.1 membrane protein [Inquilinus limosus MP06]